jgi:hypothetical protein
LCKNLNSRAIGCWDHLTHTSFERIAHSSSYLTVMTGYSHGLCLLFVLLLFASVTGYQNTLSSMRTSISLKFFEHSSRNLASSPYSTNQLMISRDQAAENLRQSHVLRAVSTPVDVDPNKSFLQKYVSALASKPITTKSIQSAIGLAIGNVIAQKFLSKVRISLADGV